MQGPVRITVDIGGTFTDLHVLEEATGLQHAHKTPTTPEDPSIGLMLGIEQSAQRFDFGLDQVRTLIHGTTIATNAVLEDKLPPAALVTNRGFRDVLEIGRHARRDVYAAQAESRRLLIPRSRRFEVGGRMSAEGVVLEDLDEDQVDAVAGLIQASGARCVAICLLHAYANAEHEQRIGERLRARLGHDFISLSHRVSPEIREYERTSTTALNALLMPVVKNYLERLQSRMKERGFAPVLYMVQSNGGVTSPAVAAEQPVRLLLSGPSGGALAAATLAGRTALSDMVAVDMGGTSFDVSVVTGGRYRLIGAGEVDGAPVRIPMVDIRTIGAGGGSIALVDPAGRLRVGPHSAGAVPGPACYGRGGTRATVTDANLVLGRIDARAFLGGTMVLDTQAAHLAVEKGVARPLGLPAQEAAEGVLRIAVAHMASAIRLSLFEKGLDPGDFALASFGGAGGLHALEVARELGMQRVVFPAHAGTLSAWGMLHCDVVHDFSRTRLTPLDDAASAQLVPLARELEAEARARLANEGVAAAETELELLADLRYPGQASELTVSLAGLEPDGACLAGAVAGFHEAHERTFAHSDPGCTPELVTLRVIARGRLPKPRALIRPRPAAPAATRYRTACLSGVRARVPVHAREDIGTGMSIPGPAFIEDEYSSIVVPGGWQVVAGDGGELLASQGSVRETQLSRPGLAISSQGGEDRGARR